MKLEDKRHISRVVQISIVCLMVWLLWLRFCHYLNTHTPIPPSDQTQPPVFYNND